MPSSPLDTAALTDEYLSAVLAPDPPRAREVVRSAADAGMETAVLYLDVLCPAMHEVGRRWESGEVSVALEHLASEVTASLVFELAARERRAPTEGRLAVVGCTPGEEHCIGSQMLGGLLEIAGWEVLYLGRSVPAEDLVSLVEAERPDAIALSTCMDDQLAGAREAIAALRALPEPPVVLVGGQAYRGRGDADAVGADAWSASAREAPAVLSERLAS